MWEMAFRVINGKYMVPYGEYEEFSGPLGAFTLMMRVAQNLRPTIPEKMPSELLKIIEKAWDPEPTNRYVCISQREFFFFEFFLSACS